MESLLQWFATTDGRLAAAAVLFAAIWALKNLPGVRKLLTTDRRRLLASLVVSLAPAVLMLADATVSARDAWTFALSTFLGAMGLQGGGKALLGQPLAAKLKVGNGGGPEKGGDK